LITTPQGNILINSDYEETVPIVRVHREAGLSLWRYQDLLGSHAHGDHMEGDALVKELTGARVIAMQEDVAALKAMTPGAASPHRPGSTRWRGRQFGDVTHGASHARAYKGCTT
jgi:glyoxylase-like metal-dependent hydrolase (beta-lactamase superfamily II)